MSCNLDSQDEGERPRRLRGLKQLMTPREVAEVLNFSVRQIYRLCDGGEIKTPDFSRPGKKKGPVRIEGAEVQAYFDRCVIEGALKKGIPLKKL